MEGLLAMLGELLAFFIPENKWARRIVYTGALIGLAVLVYVIVTAV